MNESVENMAAQLRRMSDSAGDQIDADRLTAAADLIEARPKAERASNPADVLGQLMNERIDFHESMSGGDPYYHAGALVSRELRWLWAEFGMRMDAPTTKDEESSDG